MALAEIFREHLRDSRSRVRRLLDPAAVQRVVPEASEKWSRS
jgi:hypothetical protein